MSSGNYFEDILSSNVAIQQKCLDKLVEDINTSKERTIYNFLGDSGSEDFLWSLVRLLSSDDLRISSNAAYVIGSLAETELGSHRVLSLMKGKRVASIIHDLTKMLSSEDAECVMNAAGTLGTLAETDEGRLWMIDQPYIDETLSSITNLLGYENNWTASNAALVLARLTISEGGCIRVLNHENSSHILTRLIQSLGNDAAGRGMNAAFAVGRLLDMLPGKKRLLNIPETEKMISTLCRMLTKGDMGSAKNACFAVSCLAADSDGNQRVLNNNAFNDVINRLILLLANEEDIEAAWFAAMTLRTLSSHQRGVLRLRETDTVEDALNKNYNKPMNSKELDEEIKKTLKHLKRLDCPNPPTVKVTSPTSIFIKWDAIAPTGGVDITYKLFEGTKPVYKGKDTEIELQNLTPSTTYSFKLRASTVGDESPFSDVINISTEEGYASAPCSLRVIGSTPSQIRISWSQPEHPNGILHGYSVFLGEKLLDTTYEMSHILGRLQASTSYTIHVCANTSKGPGEKATLQTRTEELGAHAPGRPSVTVIGRNEVHATWNPPAVPLGRFFRYELAANKEVIYSGTDRSFYATNLVPDHDYSFTVCAITSEGRCESEPTKKRTQKDKSLAEPGRHASKTHSFKAKEFQLEKSKTQSTIVRPKPTKKKQNLVRPSSCVSSLSDKSMKYEARQVTNNNEGSWANEAATTISTDTTGSDAKTSPATTKSSNMAILGGLPIKVDIQTVPPAGHLSMFLQKAKSEYPLRFKTTDKMNQNKLSIEPVSWNDIFPEDGDLSSNHVPGKKLFPKPKPKVVSKLEALQNEKSFISLITNNKVERSGLPRMTFIDKFQQERTKNTAASGHADMRMPREKHFRRFKHRNTRRMASPDSSDSSTEDNVARPQLQHRVEISQKLEPLTLADVIGQNHLIGKSTSDHLNIEDPRKITRVKAASKGYWSDYDAYPHAGKKKTELLVPINYKTFRGAHRPTKTFRQESPILTETWLSDLPSGGEKNKYKFIPTQLRTQPVHLPKPGKLGHRLESLTQLDLRQDTSKRIQRSINPPSTRYHDDQLFLSSNFPKHTKSYILNDGDKSLNHRISSNNSPFKANLLHEDTRNSPHQRVIITHGDAV